MKSLVCKPWEVAGILSGRITQLVRPVMPQPEEGWFVIHAGNSFHLHFGEGCDYDIQGICKNYKVIECPFGKPGDTLKALEPYSYDHNNDGEDFIIYQADCSELSTAGWLNAEDMALSDSRLTLEVLSVRVERLHEFYIEKANKDPRNLPKCHDDWNTEYPETPWESNPWVFVGEVRKVEV